MKDSSKLDLLLEKTLKFVEGTGDFVVEHAPDYVQQLLEYGFWDNAFTLILVSLLLLFFIFILGIGIYLNKYYPATIGKFPLDKALIGLGFNGFWIFLFIAVFAVPSCARNMVKIKTAPKVYIVDELKRKF